MSNTNYNDGLHYTHVFAITPGDSTQIDVRAIMVTADTSGNAVAIKTASMDSAVTMYCIKGVLYPVGGKDAIVLSTGTTADTVIGFK